MITNRVECSGFVPTLMVASVYCTVRHLEYNVGHRAGRSSSQCCFFLKEQPAMERVGENVKFLHHLINAAGLC